MATLCVCARAATYNPIYHFWAHFFALGLAHTHKRARTQLHLRAILSLALQALI